MEQPFFTKKVHEKFTRAVPMLSSGKLQFMLNSSGMAAPWGTYFWGFSLDWLSQDARYLSFSLKKLLKFLTWNWWQLMQSSRHRATVWRAFPGSDHHQHNSCEGHKLLSSADDFVSGQSSGWNYLEGSWWFFRQQHFPMRPEWVVWGHKFAST